MKLILLPISVDTDCNTDADNSTICILNNYLYNSLYFLFIEFSIFSFICQTFITRF